MAIDISGESDRAAVTFSIPDRGDDSIVSVVGSFNDWTAGTDTLIPTRDGLLAVTVVLEPTDDIHFRYLRSDGNWFDDEDADEISAFGSVVRSGRLQSALATEEIDEPDEPTAMITDTMIVETPARPTRRAAKRLV